VNSPFSLNWREEDGVGRRQRVRKMETNKGVRGFVIVGKN